MNNEFKNGFEKIANKYEFAISQHVGSFNANAALKRSKARARKVRDGDSDYMEIYTPGSKGFLGFGKRKEKINSRKKIYNNTEGQISKDPKSPAVYFSK